MFTLITASEADTWIIFSSILCSHSCVLISVRPIEKRYGTFPKIFLWLFFFSVLFFQFFTLFSISFCSVIIAGCTYRSHGEDCRPIDVVQFLIFYLFIFSLFFYSCFFSIFDSFFLFLISIFWFCFQSSFLCTPIDIEKLIYISRTFFHLHFLPFLFCFFNTFLFNI